MRSRDIVLDGEVIGRVCLLYSRAQFIDAIRDMLLVALLTLVAALAVTRLFAWRVQGVVVGPVLLLADLMKRVSKEGNYTLRAAAVGRDEIGELTEELNGMLDAIEQRDCALLVQKERVEKHRLRARRLSEELLSTGERERRKLATDLHDSVCQLLWGARLQLGMLAKDEKSDVVAGRVEEALTLVGQAMREARSLTFQLCPRHLYDLGLEVALKNLPSAVPGLEKLTFSFEASGLPEKLSDDLAILVFRCVQELGRNVVKHAGASRVFVLAKVVDGELTVSVEDDGVGFRESVDPLRGGDGGGSFGLFSVSERLQRYGGTLCVSESEYGGARVVLRVTLKEEG